jgi:hypothetical protein
MESDNPAATHEGDAMGTEPTVEESKNLDNPIQSILLIANSFRAVGFHGY